MATGADPEQLFFWDSHGDALQRQTEIQYLIEESKVRLERARALFDIDDRLYKTHSISKADFLKSRQRKDIIEATQKVLEARFAEAEIRSRIEKTWAEAKDVKQPGATDFAVLYRSRWEAVREVRARELMAAQLILNHRTDLFEMSDKLVKTGSESQTDWLTSKTEKLRAEVDVAAAKARLKAAEDALADLSRITPSLGLE